MRKCFSAGYFGVSISALFAEAFSLRLVLYKVFRGHRTCPRGAQGMATGPVPVCAIRLSAKDLLLEPDVRRRGKEDMGS